MNFSLSAGKARGLQQITGENGLFTIAAMDHRGSLEHGLCPAPGTGCYEDMVEFKLQLCAALAGHASAVLLDPIYGAAQAIGRGVLPRGAGLLVSIEATGYQGDKTARVTRVLDGWSVEKIKRLGASAVKMLVYFRPDSGELAKTQLATVEQVGEDCVKYDIPFLVEPVSYGLDGESPVEMAEKKKAVVIETARLMTALRIDVLKSEFPSGLMETSGDEVLLEACRELDAASEKPWVILSAGAEYAVFRRQVELACRAGASGFLAGRALWQEAVAMTDQSQRQRFLNEVSAGRLKELRDIVDRCGQPWYQKLGLSPQALSPVDADWYRNY